MTGGISEKQHRRDDRGGKNRNQEQSNSIGVPAPESGPEMAVNPWGLALLRTESEDIAMRTRFTPKI